MKTEEQLRQEREESYQRGLNDGLEQAARICVDEAKDAMLDSPSFTVGNRLAKAIRARIKK